MIINENELDQRKLNLITYQQFYYFSSNNFKNIRKKNKIIKLILKQIKTKKKNTWHNLDAIINFSLRMTKRRKNNNFIFLVSH